MRAPLRVSAASPGSRRGREQFRCQENGRSLGPGSRRPRPALQAPRRGWKVPRALPSCKGAWPTPSQRTSEYLSSWRESRMAIGRDRMGRSSCTACISGSTQPSRTKGVSRGTSLARRSRTGSRLNGCCKVTLPLVFRSASGLDHSIGHAVEPIHSARAELPVDGSCAARGSGAGRRAAWW